MDLSFLNNIIDEIYVIVIPQNKKYVYQMVKKYNIRVTIIDAILKKNINLKDYKLNKKIYNFGSKDGKIACYLSHIKTLKNFIKSNNNNCLILEDDFKLSDKYINYKDSNFLKNKLKNLLNSLNWEIIFLGGCMNFCFFNKHIDKFFYKTNHIICTHSYIVNRYSANKIIKNYYKYNILKPIDVEYNKLFNDKIVLKPNLFIQNNSKSNIYNSNNLLNNLSFRNSTPECLYQLLINKDFILLIIILILIILFFIYFFKSLSKLRK